METLLKGQKLNVQEKLGAKPFTLSFSWISEKDCNFEVIPFIFNNDGKLDAKNLNGFKQVKDKNSIFKIDFLVELGLVSSNIDKITFMLVNSDYDKSLDSLNDLTTYVITDEVNYEYKSENFTKEKVCFFIELYKRNNEWRLNALSRTYLAGINQVLESENIRKIEFEFYKKTLYENIEIIKPSQNKSGNKLKTNLLVTQNQLKLFKEKISLQILTITTEESTKNSLILPFLQMLGYDVFNSSEVNPEYSVNFGVKKSERVDYAINYDNNPIILIECKSYGTNLVFHNEQLFRYFGATKTAKIGILTDGVKYKIYSDLDDLNIMDNIPFLEFDLSLDISEEILIEINKFHKKNFNIESILDSARYFKLISVLQKNIINELTEPSDKFIEYFVGNVKDYGFNGQEIKEIFEKSLRNSIREINKVKETGKIVTTHEELEGFHIVRSIIRSHVDYKRVSYKDTVNYFGIHMDGSPYKAICRLWLNGKIKYLSLINDDKSETKHIINDIDDLFGYSDSLIKSAIKYR